MYLFVHVCTAVMYSRMYI